jgi:hypothetical protein
MELDNDERGLSDGTDESNPEKKTLYGGQRKDGSDKSEISLMGY